MVKGCARVRKMTAATIPEHSDHRIASRSDKQKRRAVRRDLSHADRLSRIE